MIEFKPINGKIVPNPGGFFEYTDDDLIMWYDGPLAWFAKIDGMDAIVMWNICEMENGVYTNDRYIAYCWDEKKFLVVKLQLHDVPILTILKTADKIVVCDETKVIDGSGFNWEQEYREVEFGDLDTETLPMPNAMLFN